ncbi:hypothetical protein A6J80_17440 [Paracoccus yeei]|uniref:Uncharacterized protein n=1 Tax=Paracoccus yeei TaxID=147645 RepID=A0A1V0GVM3_9RHOB|nr:hypothetical protein [Paracoccus yeei]ARC37897.1 hypothetical protein A6J80_17440 [Paracoccus yeei]
MAKAIFHTPVGYTPAKGPVGWYADPSSEPQSFPEEFIAYAVQAGAATRVDAKGELLPEAGVAPAKK